MDCTVIGGFYWQAGKALFGVCVMAAIVLPCLIGLGVATYLDRRENKK